MSKFKVGDVCVIISSSHIPELLGAECTITKIGGLFSLRDGRPRDCAIDVPGHRHLSERPEGDFVCGFSALRLKRPPSWNSWLYDTRDVEREAKRNEQLEQLQAFVDAQERSNAQP